MANTVVTLTNANVAIATADIGNTEVLVAMVPGTDTSNIALLSIASDYTTLLTQIADSLTSSANSLASSANSSASAPSYATHLTALGTALASIAIDTNDIANTSAAIATNTASIANSNLRVAVALERIATSLESLEARGTDRTKGICIDNVNDGFTAVQKRALTVSSLTTQDIADITREVKNPTSIAGDRSA